MPKLIGYAVEIAVAYDILGAHRTSGMSPNPIQLSEILSYIELYGRPSPPVALLVNMLSSMDLKYLELISNANNSSKRAN